MNSEDGLSGGKLFASSIAAGALGGLAMTTVMLLLATLFDVATPLTLVGDRISAWLPVEPFLALMGFVGGYNHLKQLGVTSVIVGQLLFGAIGMWLYAWIVERKQLSPSRRKVFAGGLFILLPMLVCAVMLWPVLGTHYSGLPQTPATWATLITLLVSFVAFDQVAVRSYTWLRSASRGSHVEPAEFTPSLGRRAFVLAGVGGLLALGSGGMLRRFYKLATFSYDGRQYGGPDVEGITPNDKFYCVTKNVVDPQVNAARWRLEIGGMVAHRRSYSFAEITAMPGVSQETTLMCISNGIGAGLMSNAVWKGVPLRNLLEPAVPSAAGAKVLLHGVDNYTDTIPLEKAMNPTTLVVYEMNGEPLPDRHGAPARMIVPGYFGEKHVKWVTRIEVVGTDVEGFYEKQGWGPDFIVPTRSRFDYPAPDAHINLADHRDGIALKGVAFAGDRGVKHVEVSADDGDTWTEAEITYPGTALTWVLWRFEWKPPGTGDFNLVVRATDGRGEVQRFDEKRSPHSGKTGLHKVTTHIA